MTKSVTVSVCMKDYLRHGEAIVLVRSSQSKAFALVRLLPLRGNKLETPFIWREMSYYWQLRTVPLTWTVTKKISFFIESLLYGSEICSLPGDQHVNIWYSWCFIQSVLAFPVYIKRQRKLEILGIPFHVSSSRWHLYFRNVALSSKHITINFFSTTEKLLDSVLGWWQVAKKTNFRICLWAGCNYYVLAQKSFSPAAKNFISYSTAVTWVSQKVFPRNFTCPGQNPLAKLQNPLALGHWTWLSFHAGWTRVETMSAFDRP